ETFNLIRSNGIECVFAHYDGEDETVIDLIRELNETRDISPVYIIVVCPGETSLTNLVKQNTDLVFDTVMLPEKLKGSFQEKIKNVFDSWQKKTVHSCLIQLRSRLRALRLGLQEPNLAPEIEAEHLKVLESRKRWFLAEGALAALMTKNKEKAAK